MADENNRGIMIGYSLVDRYLYAGLSIFVFAFYFLPFYVGWGSPGVMIYFYAGFTLVLAFPLSRFYASFTRLYLYRVGIDIQRPFSPSKFLPWEGITQIRGSLWNSTLKVNGGASHLSFRTNSSYNNANLLLELLISIRPDLFTSDLPITFFVSPLLGIFFLLVLIQSILFGIHGVFASQNGIILLSLFLICVAIFVAAAFMIPYSCSIVGDQLVLRYPRRTMVYHASEISEITRTTRFDFIYEFGEVVIWPKGEDRVNLILYNLGTSLLYAFLAAWYRFSTTPVLEAGKPLKKIEKKTLRLENPLLYSLPSRTME